MKEKLSAMLDGDVDDATVRTLLIRLKHDPAFRNEWDTYCLLGDALRGYAPPELEGFTERVMARLENEPIIFAPRRIPPPIETPAAPPDAPSRRRYILQSAAASAMGILAVIGVVATLSGSKGTASPSPALITATAIAPVRHTPAIMPNNYMFAHQTMSGGFMPAAIHYVRGLSDPTEE